MGAAFSAGFKGEEEAREKKAGAEEKEAQEQFKNAGIAQERSLALQKNAREQLDSIERSQMHSLNMDEIHQRMKFASAEESRKAYLWQRQNEEYWNTENSEGAIPIPGAPQEGFGTKEEAGHWAAQPENATIAHGGKNFNTVFSQNPYTGRWYIREIPIDTGKQLKWRGVIVNDNGDPVLKDGKMQVDKNNPLYNMQGKMVIPTDKTTLKDFNDLNAKTLEERAKINEQNAKAEELREQAWHFKQEVEKTQEMKTARAHLMEVGDDLNKPGKDGKPILTAADRDVLLHENDTMYSAAGAIFTKAQTELSAMTKDEREGPDGQKLQQTRDDAAAVLAQANSKRLAFSKTPSEAKAVFDEMVKDDPTLKQPNAKGEIDVDNFKKHLSPDIPQAVRDKIISQIETYNKTATATPKAENASAGGTPEEAVAVQAKAAAEKKAAANAEQVKVDNKKMIDKYTSPTVTSVSPSMPGATLPISNSNYNEEIAATIKSHPKWTDEEKVRYIKAKTAGVSVVIPPPPTPGAAPTPEVIEAAKKAAGPGDDGRRLTAILKEAGYGRPTPIATPPIVQ
jgi:hypothetical protein